MEDMGEKDTVKSYSICFLRPLVTKEIAIIVLVSPLRANVHEKLWGDWITFPGLHIDNERMFKL
jgi:hypothetical protein